MALDRSVAPVQGEGSDDSVPVAPQADREASQFRDLTCRRSATPPVQLPGLALPYHPEEFLDEGVSCLHGGAEGLQPLHELASGRFYLRRIAEHPPDDRTRGRHPVSGGLPPLGPARAALLRRQSGSPAGEEGAHRLDLAGKALAGDLAPQLGRVVTAFVPTAAQ